MIDYPAARTGLAAILDGQVGAKVHASGIAGVATFPAVVIGQPSWSTGPDELPYAITQTIWPIACVVARSSDQTTITGLDSLWPQVLQLLRHAAEQDPTLGGICSESIVNRADYTGRFNIQGTDYPAQLVYVELYG